MTTSFHFQATNDVTYPDDHDQSIALAARVGNAMEDGCSSVEIRDAGRAVAIHFDWTLPPAAQRKLICNIESRFHLRHLRTL